MGTWTYSALRVGAAIVSVLLVGAVSILTARMAVLGEGNNAWFLVPTLVFTAVPLAAVPVLLLLTAYLELGSRKQTVPS